VLRIGLVAEAIADTKESDTMAPTPGTVINWPGLGIPDCRSVSDPLAIGCGSDAAEAGSNEALIAIGLRLGTDGE
jgi:hypothetical protein